MNQFPMTKRGHQALQSELKQLKTVERPAVIAAIEEARAHGDLSENAEYDAAKDKQAHVEAKIRHFEGKLGNANVVDISKLSGDKVVFGATVTLIDTNTEKEEIWMIVGEDEADLQARKLSIQAPIARALVGKNMGDEVEIRTPKGTREFEIANVAYIDR